MSHLHLKFKMETFFRTSKNLNRNFAETDPVMLWAWAIRLFSSNCVDAAHLPRKIVKSSELGYYFFQAVTFTIIRCVSSFVVLTLNARLECKCDISRKKSFKMSYTNGTNGTNGDLNGHHNNGVVSAFNFFSYYLASFANIRPSKACSFSCKIFSTKLKKITEWKIDLQLSSNYPKKSWKLVFHKKVPKNRHNLKPSRFS